MKKLIIIAIVNLTSYWFAHAQPTLPLNHPGSNFDLQNGTYVKNINNLFGQYLGSWKGIWDNKELTLLIERYNHKLVSYPNSDYYYEDILIGKFEIKDINSHTIIESNLNMSNDLAKIINIGFGKNNRLLMHYRGGPLLCNVQADITLKYDPVLSNQVKFFCMLGQEIPFPNCPYGWDPPIPLPTNEEIILIKQ